MDKLILVLCLIIAAVEAQSESLDQDVNPLHPSMAVVLVALSIMVCITFVIVGYAKFCHGQELQLDANPMVQDPGGILSTRPRFSGIDRTTIESLPFFRFSSLKGPKEGLECSVCLSKFEETEILRLLPKCRHAFHTNCIDKWLENHSTCPLCRYKFDVGDLKNFSNTNSFRYPQASAEESNSNLNPNLELFVQREPSQGRSSRFNISNTLQKLSRGKRDEPLIRNNRKAMHNLKHRIIASDVMYKSRWSDVNSSDLLSLSSEMLNVASSKRFTTDHELSAKDHIMKIKEDMERKRLYESAASSCPHDSDIELDQRTLSKTLTGPAQKRSMSEITNVPRFSERSRISGSSAQGNMERDDDVRRLWLPIARRTIQMFSGGETGSEARKHAVNV